FGELSCINFDCPSVVQKSYSQLLPLSAVASARRTSSVRQAKTPRGTQSGLILTVQRCPLLALSRHEPTAFGGKADITIGTCPLSRLPSGVKRTWVVAPHMSAFDPKRT